MRCTSHCFDVLPSLASHQAASVEGEGALTFLDRTDPPALVDAQQQTLWWLDDHCKRGFPEELVQACQGKTKVCQMAAESLEHYYEVAKEHQVQGTDPRALPPADCDC